MSDYSLLRERDERWREAQPLLQQWQREAATDTKFYLGDRSYYNWLYSGQYQQQGELQFNKVLRIINMIGGYQRQNRNVSIVTPVDNDDNETSDELTAALMWAHNKDETYEKISSCFDWQNIAGLSFLHCWVDYRQDPQNGDIRTNRVNSPSIAFDPWWREPDLSDCQWFMHRRYMTKDQVVSLLPTERKEIEGMKPLTNNGQDGKFIYMPENRQMYTSQSYTYDEYWTQEYKQVKKLHDRKTGEVIDIPRRMNEDQLNVFLRLNPNVRVIKVQKPTVRLHILVNDNLIWEELEPYGSCKLPYVPFIGTMTPEAQDYAFRFMGTVRNIRDSQIEVNKRHNKFFSLLDSQTNSGMIVKEDALVDPEDAFLQGEGKVYYLQKGAQMSDIAHIPPPQIPPSWFELTQMLDKEIMEIAGVTEELFGKSDDSQMSGFLQKLRQSAGVTGLQTTFDNLRRSQKFVAELFLDYIQSNMSAGKARRILNKKEISQEFKDKTFQEYDCVVEEGVLTSTQKQMEFVQLLQLREMGIAVPTEFLLEKATIQGKNELIEAIKQVEEQQAKQAAEQAELEKHQLAIQTRAYEAKAQADFATAQERQGRTISNIGLYAERESEQAQNKASAALDYVKAMKELQEMDDNRLYRLAEMVLQIQDAQKQTTRDVDMQGVQVADFVGKDVDVAKQETEVPKQKQADPAEQLAGEVSPV